MVLCLKEKNFFNKHFYLKWLILFLTLIFSQFGDVAFSSIWKKKVWSYSLKQNIHTPVTALILHVSGWGIRVPCSHISTEKWCYPHICCDSCWKFALLFPLCLSLGTAIRDLSPRLALSSAITRGKLKSQNLTLLETLILCRVMRGAAVKAETLTPASVSLVLHLWKGRWQFWLLQRTYRQKIDTFQHLIQSPEILFNTFKQDTK